MSHTYIYINPPTLWKTIDHTGKCFRWWTWRRRAKVALETKGYWTSRPILNDWHEAAHTQRNGVAKSKSFFFDDVREISFKCVCEVWVKSVMITYSKLKLKIWRWNDGPVALCGLRWCLLALLSRTKSISCYSVRAKNVSLPWGHIMLHFLPRLPESQGKRG